MPRPRKETDWIEIFSAFTCGTCSDYTEHVGHTREAANEAHEVFRKAHLKCGRKKKYEPTA